MFKHGWPKASLLFIQSVHTSLCFLFIYKTGVKDKDELSFVMAGRRPGRCWFSVYKSMLPLSLQDRRVRDRGGF